MKPIIVIQGAQFGSEGKGMVAAWLCNTRHINYAVRTGSVNAGHTVYYKGKPYKMQQLPTGWVNPRTKLVIGAGAFIHEEILYKEAEMVDEAMPEFAPVRERIYIDKRAGVVTKEHSLASDVAGDHYKFGATGKGCGKAYVDKIVNRNNGYKLFSFYNRNHWMNIVDTVELLNSAYDDGKSILIEGTQGTFLDLHLGPYPYTTHKQTQCATWISECGLSPSLEYEVILVARTYPIRVAGNSGPMGVEIGWPTLARRINQKRTDAELTPIVRETSIRKFEKALEDAHNTHSGPKPRDLQVPTLERERFQKYASDIPTMALKRLDPDTFEDLYNLFELTTVTKKLRRIAEFDVGMMKEAVMMSRPNAVILTFFNYLYPELWLSSELEERHYYYLRLLESQIGVDISHVTTGPEEGNIVETWVPQKSA